MARENVRFSPVFAFSSFFDFNLEAGRERARAFECSMPEGGKRRVNLTNETIRFETHFDHELYFPITPSPGFLRGAEVKTGPGKNPRVLTNWSESNQGPEADEFVRLRHFDRRSPGHLEIPNREVQSPDAEPSFTPALHS
jgi:hypothetical protein